MPALLFKGTQANATTAYYSLPTDPDGDLMIHAAWKDATSNATITLQFSLFPPSDAPANVAGDAWEWINAPGVTITGPTGAAAGGSFTHVGNIGGRVRARLRVVTTADSVLEIWSESD